MLFAGDASAATKDAAAGEGADRRGSPRARRRARRQLPGLIDVLITEHHDALLDRLELRINEAAKDVQGSTKAFAGADCIGYAAA